ncbi:hypothetical protein HKBW3C_02411 [Candidatus Hakubella thermalkaliphila]|nr:hypothetical protein HKBW3C_02411 [Candidatus Hakubella thermalkaliphila]
MRVRTLSFAGSTFTSRQEYLDYLDGCLASREKCDLLVFPALLSLLLAWRFGELGSPGDLAEAVRALVRLPAAWQDDLAETHRALARGLSVHLVPGTSFTVEGDRVFQEACLISPEGEILGSQRQVFLSREERQWELSRGEEVPVFATELGMLGIIVGTDAWYPETGRVLALQGAEVVCHCGALPAGENCWCQLAGMWAQVQQNQFFCVESQLAAVIAGREFAAESLIHAPCEMTAGYTGIVAGGGLSGEPLEAHLDREARLGVIRQYPLLKLLDPAAYSPLGCRGGGGNS